MMSQVDFVFITKYLFEGEKLMTTNNSVLKWVEKIKEIVNPENVVWIDGSEKQLNNLRKEACDRGELIQLNQEKLQWSF